MATRFAAAGMRLVLADIEEQPLAAAVDDFRAAGAEVVGVRTDVAVAADVEALRDRALDAFGAVHVVCNNAGVGGSGIVGAPLEVWDWVIGVNLWGVVHGVHTFLPLLLEQNEGHIVNTASLAGLGGVPGLGIYCTTKFAVVGLSESLYYDLRGLDTEVGVSVLCPGFVQTQIGESARNAPATLAPWTGTDSAQSTRNMANALAAAGIPAADVADAVLDAIGTGAFFVLPHAHAAQATTRGRLAWMEGGEAPRLDPTRALQP
jgi:NAD(P)-dependent dehydrogenase (short-subunit alcohol dehydrogenase family)